MDTDLRRRAVPFALIVFALHAFALGGWLVFIPFVKESLALNKAELSLALLGLPVATIPSLQIAARAIGRWGPRRILAVGFPLQAVAVLLPLMAVSGVTLFLALMVFGMALAFLQVCLNVYAGRLEKQLDALVMNRCHGFWALGLMAAPILVTALAGLPPLAALAIVAGASAAVGSWAALRLPKLSGEDAAKAPPRRKIADMPRALFLISIFALFIAMVEGAMSDWTSVYMAERLPTGSRWVGIGVSIYAGMLAVGRLSGDWVKARVGAVALARGTLGIAVIGLLCLCLPLPLGFAYLGFALVGAGASVGFPLGVSAVAALDDRYEGANIAVMSSLAIMGFLVGPPLIGFLAEAFSLRVGLAALIPGLCVGFYLAGWLNRGDLTTRTG